MSSVRSASYREHQPSFDDLGTLLSEVTFVVVDLETTGSGPDAAITEIGAVKMRGGQVLGEFQTLVNPRTHISALIAVLTGITDQMVADAPRIEQALPSFLEFARGSVLVAHNAGFDIGFLKRACEAHGRAWINAPVVDTVSLARQVLLRDEVPNCKLGTLAAHFNATTVPNHRALSDARATVDVLHALVERVGNLGVHTLEDLNEFTHKVSPQRRAKRTWAANLPDSPGVYVFYAEHPHDADRPREVLYVGKSVRIRTRVRSYFTASEKRARMEEMVRVATGVEAYPCSTPLEAEVRELRLIQSHQPRYNRRSRRQDTVVWVRLTEEAFPRLSVVRTVPENSTWFGPFTSRQDAEAACLALYDAVPVRQCTKRLSARTASSSCVLGEMSRCPAPCELGEGATSYPEVVERARRALGPDAREVTGVLSARMAQLSAQQRYEQAAAVRERLDAYTRASRRMHRIRSLALCPQIVAARRADDGGWHLHVIRHGRLAGAAHSRPDEVPQAIARQLVADAETVLAPVAGIPACSIEEAERVAAWLEGDGVRLIDIEGDWAWPLHGVVPAASTVPAATLAAEPSEATSGKEVRLARLLGNAVTSPGIRASQDTQAGQDTQASVSDSTHTAAIAR